LPLGFSRSEKRRITARLNSDVRQDSTVIVNAFTVDVEDYFQVSAFEKHIPRDQWDRWESRVEANTHRILQLLDRHGVKATFFVLGWIAERYPELVREIHACGHEIGSHTYWHRLIYEQTPAEFRADLRRSRDVLQATIGQPVTAHRAASFSITKQSLWALEILVEEGFLVDSSVFPIHHDRYGIPGAEPRLHRLITAAGPLWEFPPSVARFAGLNVPVSGGGYFRLYPLPWTLYCLRRINRVQRQPFVVYFHPWEFDPGQPRIRASQLSRFRHYVNLSRNQRKLDGLLRRFHFGRLYDAIARQAARDDPGPAGYPRTAKEQAIDR
jgi:polysaccharide deacetylase family protein (PEP-CTERM system associated)